MILRVHHYSIDGYLNIEQTLLPKPFSLRLPITKEVLHFYFQAINIKSIKLLNYKFKQVQLLNVNMSGYMRLC